MAATEASEFMSQQSPTALREALLTKVVPWAMEHWRYELKQQANETITIGRRYLPGWALLIGILTIPGLIGILILIFYRREDTVTFTIVPGENGGSKILVNGTGDLGFFEDLHLKLAKLA